jgi:hypothetical protein
MDEGDYPPAELDFQCLLVRSLPQCDGAIAAAGFERVTVWPSRGRHLPQECCAVLAR